jgi:hypothetical protein
VVVFFGGFGGRGKEGSGNGELSLLRAPVGEPGVVSFLGLFERHMEGSENGASLIEFNWTPFLDPDYVRSLSLGAI